MNDEQIELAVALAIRRNWDDARCGYAENCSDKDISLFLNVPIEVVVRVRLSTMGNTRTELEASIQAAIQDDLSIIERMMDPREITGWIEEARKHLRNMQSNLYYADELMLKTLQIAKAGDRKTLIKMLGDELWQLKNCLRDNFANTVFVRNIYKRRFAEIERAADHIEKYLENELEYVSSVHDVIEDKSMLKEVLEEASTSQIRAGYKSAFTTKEV